MRRLMLILATLISKYHTHGLMITIEIPAKRTDEIFAPIILIRYDISAAAIRLSSVRASLLLTSMLTAIWRVPILWVLVQCFGVSIPVLGIIYVADYGTRTLVYRIMLKRDSAKVKTADIAV